MHSNRAALMRVRTEPNSVNDLIEAAMREGRIALAMGDIQQATEYAWLVGELEAIKRGAK